jgi:MFS family permease
VCLTALGIAAVSFAAPAITVVGLKSIAADLGGERSVPALAYSLAWLGASVGGIAMGQAAERFGVRATVIFGSLMIAAGLLLAQSGDALSLLIGYGVFIGLLGNAGMNAPLYTYVSRWFDRRRGTALALLGSGSSVSAAIWAPIFAAAEAQIGSCDLSRDLTLADISFTRASDKWDFSPGLTLEKTCWMWTRACSLLTDDRRKLRI